MGMRSDGKATTLTSTGGAVFGGPARIMGIHFVSSATAGSIIIKDGGSGGTALATFATPAAVNVGYIDLSASPIRCETSAYGALSNVTSATVVYA
jgi:hypothetical protein